MAEKSDKADKPAKFIDIKAPDKTAPSASSRPLVVTNRSVITNDPMVNPPADESADDKPAEQPMARTAKTIKPVSADLLEPEKVEDKPAAETDSPEPEETPVEAPAEADKPAAAKTPIESDKPAETADPTPAADADADDEETPAPVSRDVEAASQADEAKAAATAQAEAARQDELEQLISSGKYRASINVGGRKRSRALAVVLCLIATVLAFAVVDAGIDAGLVQVDGVPHTDFLKDK